MPALLAAPFVPRLTTLRLAGEMCHEALVALPSARALVSLAELSMRGLGLNAPFLLSAALPLPGLRTLDLSFFAHPLWDARRLHTVLASPLAARVEEVRLAIPGHGRVVHSWWLEAPPSPLRWLDLSNHGFLPEDAVTLANSPSFARLEHLNLRGNILESAGVVPLARSPHFAQLRALLLHFNGIGDEGAVELARSPSMANLLWLDLTANRLTDRAGFALANSPILTNLARLDIQRNDFSDRARQALVDRFGAGVAL
jgi:hypothetical protein